MKDSTGLSRATESAEPSESTRATESGDPSAESADPSESLESTDLSRATDSPRTVGSARVNVTTSSRTLRRWDVGLTVALIAGGIGLVLGRPAIFLSAAVGFAYASYRFLSRPPELDLDADRVVSDRAPRPGRDVDVTLTVTNAGAEPIADLRIVDGVPEQLGVVDGSPRQCTSLRPGESTTLSYAVRPRRGTHRFDDVVVVAQSVSGADETRATVAVETTLTCEEIVETMPIRGQTLPSSGRNPTAAAGEGIEFYSTRRYYPSDPMRRIDWKRYASTGELSTVEFRETRAATIVLLIDTRASAWVIRRAGEPDAVTLAAQAATHIAEALLDESNRVGAALYGPTAEYLQPGTGASQALRIRRLVDGVEPPAETDSFGSHDVGDRVNFERLCKRLPSDAQVVFLSPLLDDGPSIAVRRLEARGHAVTVLSPDVTSSTPGGIVAGVERRERARSLRQVGIRVAEWSPDDPLETALTAVARRWA